LRSTRPLPGRRPSEHRLRHDERVGVDGSGGNPLKPTRKFLGSLRVEPHTDEKVVAAENRKHANAPDFLLSYEISKILPSFVVPVRPYIYDVIMELSPAPQVDPMTPRVSLSKLH